MSVGGHRGGGGCVKAGREIGNGGASMRWWWKREEGGSGREMNGRVEEFA